MDDADENDVDHAEDATYLKLARPRNGGYGLCFRFGPRCPVPRAVHASVVVSVDAETPTCMREPGGARQPDVGF